MGFFNRSARQSGGYRKVRILCADGTKVESEALKGIACFEKRHKDCEGKLFMMPGNCGCSCHNNPLT